MKIIFQWYALLLGRKMFYKFNQLLYVLSLRGMGVLNYENNIISGEQSFLRKNLCAKGKLIIFDVGANQGDYTKMCLSINPDANIHSFEPHPETFQKLLERFIGNSNIHPENFAVSDCEGNLKLFDYEENKGSSHASVYPGVLSDIHSSESVTSRDVRVIDLKTYIVNNKIKGIDLLKIDTEGNELKCLIGLGDFINDGFVKIIHFEFNEMNIISRATFKDFWELLNRYYDIYRLLPSGELLELNYRAVYTEIYAFQNIVAVYRK